MAIIKEGIIIVNTFSFIRSIEVNESQKQVPYYQDELFDKQKDNRQYKPNNIPQSNQNSSQSFNNYQNKTQKNKRRFFIKPYTVYNFEEKQLLTLRPRNWIYKDRGDGFLICTRVGYMIMKITPMAEENNSGKFQKFTPNYEEAWSFVLTSKNIGSILALKTTNNIKKYELKDQILESTTAKSLTDDYLTLLKVEKKEKEEAKDDFIEFAMTYFEAKDDKLIRSTQITLSLGQMIVFQALCKRFLTEAIHGWSFLKHK